MTTAFITHPDCLRHDMGAHHPERPARLTAIEDQLIASGLAPHLTRYEAPLATDEQLASVDGDSDRYDAELRPELMRRAIEQIHAFGVDVDVWKIEGVDAQQDAEMLIREINDLVSQTTRARTARQSRGGSRFPTATRLAAGRIHWW